MGPTPLACSTLPASAAVFPQPGMFSPSSPASADPTHPCKQMRGDSKHRPPREATEPKPQLYPFLPEESGANSRVPWSLNPLALQRGGSIPLQAAEKVAKLGHRGWALVLQVMMAPPPLVGGVQSPCSHPESASQRGAEISAGVQKEGGGGPRTELGEGPRLGWRTEAAELHGCGVRGGTQSRWCLPNQREGLKVELVPSLLAVQKA